MTDTEQEVPRYIKLLEYVNQSTRTASLKLASGDFLPEEKRHPLLARLLSVGYFGLWPSIEMATEVLHQVHTLLSFVG